MAKDFSYTLQAEAVGVKERILSGSEIHGNWNVFHKNPDDRGMWVVDETTGFLQITTNQNGLSGRYNPAHLNATDYDFITEIIPSGVDDDAFGIHFRYKDNFHFYFVQWDGGGEYNWKPNLMRLYKVENETYTLLGSSEVMGPWKGGTKYKFAVEVKGNVFVVKLDGQEYIRAVDNDRPYLSGAYGPCATSQVCTWTKISSFEETPFVLNVTKNASVTIENYTYETGLAIGGGTAYKQVEEQLKAYILNNGYIANTGAVERYTVASGSEAIEVYFHPEAPVKVSTQGGDFIYAYMKYDEQAPTAPSQFMGVPEYTTARWTWKDNARFEDGFEIYDEYNNLLATLGANATSWDEYGLKQDTTYTRTLRAYNRFGVSEEIKASIKTLFSAMYTTPDAPIELRGVTVDTTRINWYFARVKNADGYRFYDKDGKFIKEVGTTRMLEEGLTPDSMYTRYVTAFNDAGESGRSNLASAFTDAIRVPGPVPAAPLNFQAQVMGVDAIRWFWDEVEGEDIQYRLYDLNGEILYEAPQGVTEFLEQNLIPGTSYSHYVVAFNADGESHRSNYAYATTMTEPVEPEPVPDEEEEWDPSQVVCVPLEQEPAEQMEAFHSGIGNGLDLKVRIAKTTTAKELFTYDLQLKGYEYVNTPVYSQVDFRFRFKAEGTENGEPWLNYSPWYNGSVNGSKPYTEDNSFGKKNLIAPVEVSAGSDVSISKWSVEVDDPQGIVSYYMQNGTKDTTTKINDAVVFSSEMTSEEKIRHVWYGSKLTGQTVYVVTEGETVEIKDRIVNPSKDAALSSKNITEWFLIVSSKNPNVEVKEISTQHVWAPELTFVDVRLQARLINPAQTSWNPLIHNGFYYLNQKEHYLYGESKVLGEVLESQGAQTVEFPYGISVACERFVSPQSASFYDTDRSDYKGTTSLTDLDTELGSIMLKKVNGDYVNEGSYTSDVKTIQAETVEALEKISWMENAPFSSEVIIETSTQGADGWSPWVKAVNGGNISSPVTNKIRYRATLKVGIEERPLGFSHISDSVEDFYKGEFSNVSGLGGKLQMNDTELTSGYWNSPVIDMGTQITDMGKVSYLPLLPGFTGEAVEVLTVSSDNQTGPWDGSGEPLLPLVAVTRDRDGLMSGVVSSAKKRYLRYQIRLTRGKEEKGFTKNLTLNQSSTFETEALSMGHVTSYKDIQMSVTMPYSEGSVKLYTISGTSPSNVTELAKTPENWKEVVDNQIQSNPLDFLKVKAEVVPGKSEVTIKTVKHDSLSEFSGATFTNVKVDAPGALSLIDVYKEGVYESHVMDFTNVDTWLKLIPAMSLNGGTVKAETSVADTLSGPWSDWEPVKVNGDIASPKNNLIRYKLTIAAGTSEGVLTVSDDTEAKFQDGASLTNAEYNVTRVRNTNPELGFTYVSGKKTLTDVKDDVLFAYSAKLANEAEAKVYTQTSDDDVTWTPWVLLEAGKVKSPTKKYIRYKFEVTRGYADKRQMTLLHNNSATFSNPAPTTQNVKVGIITTGEGLSLDVKVNNQKVLQTGKYYSGVEDFKGRVSGALIVNLTSKLPEVSGGIKVYVIASNNKETITGDPSTLSWEEGVIDTAGKYVFANQTGRYVRFRVDLSAGYSKVVNRVRQQNTTGDWNTNVSATNISLLNNQLSLSNALESGEFVSNVMDFYTAYDRWLRYTEVRTDITGANQGGLVQFFVRSAKSASAVTSSAWVSIGAASSGSLILAAADELSHDNDDLPYFQYKLELTPGRSANIAAAYEEAASLLIINSDDTNVKLNEQNKLQIDTLDTETIPVGTYVSAAKSITDFYGWGKFESVKDVAQGSVEFYTDVQGADGEWEGWTLVSPDGSVNSRSDDVLFIRMKAELAAGKDSNGDWMSPEVSSLKMNYVTAAPMSPKVTNVQVTSNIQSAQTPEVSYLEVATQPLGFEGFAYSEVGDASLSYTQIRYSSPYVDAVSASARSYTTVNPIVTKLDINADVIYWRSPGLDKAELKSTLFELVRHTPMLHEVRIGYRVPARYLRESYTVAMVGQVPADSNRHAITELTLKEIIDNYMVERGISQSGLTRSQYSLASGLTGIFVETKDNNASEHYATGNSPVIAYTTDAALETIYSQAKVFVREDNTALITPIPQQGAPVIVQDAAGKELREVFFLNPEGEITLTNTEELLTDGTREVNLAYANLDHDTVEIWVDEKRTSVYTKVEGYVLCNNIVYLPKIYPANTPVRISYNILDSFVIDYNFDVQNDYARLSLYKPTLDSSREIKVHYETGRNTAYYTASEVNLNPMQSLYNEGFIYLTNEVKSAKKLEVYFNPIILPANGYDRTTIIVLAKDEVGNPVSGDLITFEASDGNVVALQEVTDENGLAFANYTAGFIPGEVSIRIQNVTSKIEQMSTLYLKDMQSRPRVSLEINKDQLLANGEDEVQVTARVVNDKQMAAGEIMVDFISYEGSVSIASTKTNYIGEAYTYIKASKIPEDGLVTIEVQLPEYGVRTYMNIPTA